MSYKEISKEEALQWLDFSTSISRWKALYQCTNEEANNKVINCLDERIIKRLGAFAKDKDQKLNISMAFRPFSYQENLAPNNSGKWNCRYDANKSIVDNLKCWYGGNWNAAAAPGTSNHNTGAAVDAVSYWFKNIYNSDLAPYGLTKNVKEEWWHVVVVEMASIGGYDRVKYAYDMGYEPQICPCQINYKVGGYNKEGVSVALVQAKLNALGYDCGTVDGNFGEKTKAAVERFQKDKGLLVDGVVGGKTIAALFTEKFTVTRLLKLTKPMMTGDDVKWLQERLNANGARLVVDGIFGSNTKNAVMAYQGTKGLTIDGIAGKNTITALGGNFKG